MITVWLILTTRLLSVAVHTNTTSSAVNRSLFGPRARSRSSRRRLKQRHVTGYSLLRQPEVLLTIWSAPRNRINIIVTPSRQANLTDGGYTPKYTLRVRYIKIVLLTCFTIKNTGFSLFVSPTSNRQSVFLFFYKSSFPINLVADIEQPVGCLCVCVSACCNDNFWTTWPLQWLFQCWNIRWGTQTAIILREYSIIEFRFRFTVKLVSDLRGKSSDGHLAVNKVIQSRQIGQALPYMN